MDFILEIFNTYGKEILGTILVALAGVVATTFKRLATRYVNTEIKRNVAYTVVQGIEQLYYGLSGPDKLAKAMVAAANMLTAEGIKVTDLELRMLLEAAVGEFNEVFHTATALEGIRMDDAPDGNLQQQEAPAETLPTEETQPAQA